MKRYQYIRIKADTVDLPVGKLREFTGFPVQPCIPDIKLCSLCQASVLQALVQIRIYDQPVVTAQVFCHGNDIGNEEPSASALYRAFLP